MREGTPVDRVHATAKAQVRALHVACIYGTRIRIPYLDALFVCGSTRRRKSYCVLASGSTRFELSGVMVMLWNRFSMYSLSKLRA